MSRRVSVSIRRLMLPFESLPAERSTTAVVVSPPSEEWPFGIRWKMGGRIHNVNTRGETS